MMSENAKVLSAISWSAKTIASFHIEGETVIDRPSTVLEIDERN
jgi:hypothetical protein